MLVQFHSQVIYGQQVTQTSPQICFIWMTYNDKSKAEIRHYWAGCVVNAVYIFYIFSTDIKKKFGLSRCANFATVEG